MRSFISIAVLIAFVENFKDYSGSKDFKLSLSIKTTDSILNHEKSSFELQACLINNTEKTILVRNDTHFNYEASLQYESAWWILIYYKDSLLMTSRNFAHIDRKSPMEYKDYVKLIPQDSINIKCKIDIHDCILATIPLSTPRNRTNRLYGLYSIQLIYKDMMCRFPECLTDSLVSNTIFIRFEK